MSDQSQTPGAGRAGIIQAVTTPLNFFALTVLAIEAILLVLASNAPHDTHLLITIVMLTAFVALVVTFVAIAVYRPDMVASNAILQDRAANRTLEEAIFGLLSTTEKMAIEGLTNSLCTKERPSSIVYAAIGRLKNAGVITLCEKTRYWKLTGKPLP